MMRFSQLFRETIDEMADELKPPSAALVTVAIARGRRIRRGRRLTAASGALLAVAAVTLPWAILSRPDGSATGGPAAETLVTGTPAASGAARSRGAGLAGGWVVTSAGSQVLTLSTDGTVTATTTIDIPGADTSITLGPPH